MSWTNPEPRKPVPDKFPHPIAFNLIPHIDVFQENGFTKEEMKCVKESRKILNDPGLLVRPPHGPRPGLPVAFHLRSPGNGKELSVAKARALIRRAKGVRVYDDPARASTPCPGWWRARTTAW